MVIAAIATATFTDYNTPSTHRHQLATPQYRHNRVAAVRLLLPSPTYRESSHTASRHTSYGQIQALPPTFSTESPPGRCCRPLGCPPRASRLCCHIASRPQSGLPPHITAAAGCCHMLAAAKAAMAVITDTCHSYAMIPPRHTLNDTPLRRHATKACRRLDSGTRTLRASLLDMIRWQRVISYYYIELLLQRCHVIRHYHCQPLFILRHIRCCYYAIHTSWRCYASHTLRRRRATAPPCCATTTRLRDAEYTRY